MSVSLPRFSLIIFNSWFKSLILSSFTLTITSPFSIPALKAGEPGTTALIITSPPDSD